MGIIGDLRRSTREEVTFEWKIPNFLQLPGELFGSPKFSFCSEDWHIRFYPIFCFDIFVNPMSKLSVPISVDYSFHFKTVDGKADTDSKFNNTHIFKEGNSSTEMHRIMSRSKLIEKQSQLLPSGVLTVICTMKKNGTNDGDGVLKLQQHFEEIYQNESFSDVVLKVGGQEFKSHRCVLARSPVFLAMMTHDMKEKNTGVVDVQDIDPDTFSYFLRYLYTGSQEIVTSKNVLKLHTAADKYQVDELKRSCLDYMVRNISVDNFCDMLRLSMVHVETYLAEACSQFFIENTEAVVLSPMWLTFLKENPVASNELHLKQIRHNKKNEN